MIDKDEIENNLKASPGFTNYFALHVDQVDKRPLIIVRYKGLLELLKKTYNLLGLKYTVRRILIPDSVTDWTELDVKVAERLPDG